MSVYYLKKAPRLTLRATQRGMKITKCYLYISVFDVGRVELCEKSYLAGIQEAAWRARTIPQHRISIEAYEDSEDARELGAAARRLDFLRTLMLAAGIRGERLETQAHMVASGSEVPGDFARHAEIRLYPRVPSLCPAVGDALLNYREVSWLQTARQAALFSDHEARSRLERLCGREEWLRMVGHESFAEWVALGARHPLYEVS